MKQLKEKSFFSNNIKKICFFNLILGTGQLGVL